MTLRMYVTDDIDTVIATVREQNSKISPNYLASVPKTPSALKRNLKEILSGTERYSFSVSPLVVPASHSSGAPQNSRSLDYDVVVSNTDAAVKQPFLILDTGLATFQVSFREALIEGEPLDEAVLEDANDTEIVFNIDSFEIADYNLLRTFQNKLVFEGLDLKSTVNLIVPNDIGSITCKALQTLNLDLVDATYDFSLETDTFSVTVPRVLTEEAIDVFKEVSLFRTVGDNSVRNNLRIAGAVTYIPTLDTYVPVNNMSDSIPNLRDFLDQKGRPSYPGYLIELGLNEGVLLNNELLSLDTTTFNAQTMPDSFSSSSLALFDSVAYLFVGSAIVISTTGSITKISVGQDTSDGWQDTVTITDLSIANLKSVLEPYGVFPRVLTKNGQLQKLYLQRMSFDAGYSETLSFRVSATEDFEIQSSGLNLLAQMDDLPTATVYPTYKLTEYADLDELGDGSNITYIADFDLGIDQQKPLHDSVCTLYLKTNGAIQMKVNTASSQIYTQYVSSSYLFEAVSEKTSKLATYGYEKLLTQVANAISSKTGYAVSVDVDRGCIHVNSSQKSKQNLYLSFKYSPTNTTPFEYKEPSNLNNQLKIESGNFICSETEVLVFMEDSFKHSPTVTHGCRYVIVDIEATPEVTFVPFAYAVDGTLVLEQVLYNITLSSADFYKNFLSSDAIFFCSVLPIFENGVKTSKYLISLKDTALDGKPLNNLLIRTDSGKTGLSSANALVSVGTTNSTQESLAITENQSLMFLGDYASVNRKYGTTAKYATACDFTLLDLEGSLTLSIQSLDGVIESYNLSHTPDASEDTFTEKFISEIVTNSAHLTATENAGVITLSLKETAPDILRLVVTPTEDLLTFSRGVYEQFDTSFKVLLEREVS